MHGLLPLGEKHLQKLIGTAHQALDQKLEGLDLGDRRWNHSELEKMSDADLNGLFNATPYDSVTAQMGTGDVLLLHGTELFSAAIKFVTRSWYSHAAVVLRDPPEDLLLLYGLTADKRDPDQLYAFESDSSTEDLREGGGVQMLPLGAWVKEMSRYYVEEKKSRFFLVWRRAKYAGRPDSPQRVSDFPALLPVIKEAHHKKYEDKLGSLLSSIVHGNQAEDLSAVFCSELVAWVLKTVGLLPPTENASNWTPIQFSVMYHNDQIKTVMAGRGELEADRRLLLHAP